MQIHGFAKTTLLDYPKHVAATVFTGHCNFRCPFCHNKDLVLDPESIPMIPEEDIFFHLKKRQGILEGICITGGEPTLQKDLPDFIRRVKELGYKVKLDTNGYAPEVLEMLLSENLLDYVAMDIKNSPEKYAETCGLSKMDVERIRSSVELLKNQSIPFEFRTTVVRELHEPTDLISIAQWICGAPAYYLQSYRESENVICSGFSSYSKEELSTIKNMLSEYVPTIELRGID